MTRSTRHFQLLVAFACLAFLPGLATAGSAAASRALLSKAALRTTFCLRCGSSPPGGPLAPHNEGEIEGACGLAVGDSGQVYVSDYYHREIHLFSSSGEYNASIALGGENSVSGVNALDSACGLALDSSGNLLANEFHQSVGRLGEAPIDDEGSTGLAVDPLSGDLYVDDRTSVARYQAPFGPDDPPVETIPLGEGADAYGIAAYGGRIYVPDASTDSVRVFEPSVAADEPVLTIPGFNSLLNAVAAVDPSNGHLLVVDNLQPGFEHPQGVVKEFAASGAFLGQLPGSPVDGEPSGLAIDPATGVLYVTDGNGELANAFKYGAYGSAPVTALSSPSPVAVEDAVLPSQPAASQAATTTPLEVVQRAGFRVAIDARLAPKRLPRSGSASVRFTLGARFIPLQEALPPQLRRIRIEINRHGALHPGVLPRCTIGELQPSTTAEALSACGPSLVGEGHSSAKISLAQEAPFPSEGKLLAFNGSWHGRPAILAHIYGPKPVPTSVTIPFSISRTAGGTYGTVLTASLPRFSSRWGYVTALSMTLGRDFTSHGRRVSYLSAGCPAPKGFRIVTFRLAHTTFSFGSAPRTVQQTLVRSCRAR
jgi:hypothetical protein